MTTRTLQNHPRANINPAKPFSLCQIPCAASSLSSGVIGIPWPGPTSITSCWACELTTRTPSCGLKSHQSTANTVSQMVFRTWSTRKKWAVIRDLLGSSCKQIGMRGASWI